MTVHQQKDECPICYSYLRKDTRIQLPNCAHMFCKTCVCRLKELQDTPTCPVCRTTMLTMKDDNDRDVKQQGMFASSRDLFKMGNLIGL